MAFVQPLVEPEAKINTVNPVEVWAVHLLRIVVDSVLFGQVN